MNPSENLRFEIERDEAWLASQLEDPSWLHVEHLKFHVSVAAHEHWLASCPEPPIPSDLHQKVKQAVWRVCAETPSRDRVPVPSGHAVWGPWARRVIGVAAAAAAIVAVSGPLRPPPAFDASPFEACEILLASLQTGPMQEDMTLYQVEWELKTLEENLLQPVNYFVTEDPVFDDLDQDVESLWAELNNDLG